MTEHEFFDTNIILYAIIDKASPKHGIAKELLENKIQYGEPCISIQVVNEFTVNAIRQKKELPEIETTVRHLLTHFHVQSLTTKHVLEAFRIVKRYGFSFWDSLIISAALDMQCTVLYTEDLHNGQWIDDVMQIRNPFVNEKQ